MAAYNRIDAFLENLAEKVHDCQNDTFKIMLTNTAPIATNTVKADLIEITAQNGYPAGGSQAVVSSSSQTSGTYKQVLADVTFTATGGGFGPFQYVVLYNDTPTAPADPLIAWWVYTTSTTLGAGETFTHDFNAASGAFTIAPNV